MSDNSLELYSKINNPLEGIKTVGEFLAKSQMFGCQNPEQGMVIAMTCMSEGISIMQFKRRFHLINGEVGNRADSMLADFRTIKGGKHKIIERTPEAAEIELTLDGQTQRFRFTFEDAKKEFFAYDSKNNLKKNYATPYARTQVLWARVCSEGVHTMAPELTSGSAIEELEDTTPAKEIKLATPAPATATVSAPAPKAEVAKPTVMPKPETTKIIDAEIVKEPTSEPPKAATSGTPPTTPTPPPAASSGQFTPGVDPATGKLNKETAAKLAEIMGEHAEECFAWLVKVSWITKDQTIIDLPMKRVELILRKPDAFVLKAIAETTPTQPTA